MPTDADPDPSPPASPTTTDRSRLLVDAAFRRPTTRRPIWLMRQAGRYLPEYRAVREKHSFLTMCKTPELAVEISLQPWRRFQPDGVIVFSDILYVCEAMGQTLDFAPGPKLAAPIRDRAAIDRLAVPDPTEGTPHILEALRLLRAELDGQVPVLGFCGAPWTLATYMVEGEHSRDLRHAKGLRYSDEPALRTLLDKLTDALILYCRAMIDAGAQVLQIFDSHGGELTSADFRALSLPTIQRLVAGIRAYKPAAGVPLIVFCKGGGNRLEALADTGADVVSIDWMTDMADARARIGDRVALQGNFDPLLLTAPHAAIDAAVDDAHALWGTPQENPGWIANLGHGCLPFLDPDRVTHLVQSFS